MQSEQQFGDEVEAKASLLAIYKQRYYQGQASVPDEVYDALEDELRRLAPNHPILRTVGFEPSGAKVAHDPPMLSLLKSYDAEEIAQFVKQHQEVCLTDKLDGMALALEFDQNGVLVCASTRGNGSLGENVTAHVRLVPAIPKTVATFPGFFLEVRGEVYFPLEGFAGFLDRFDSFRNAVPGSFGRKDPAEAADVLAHFEFCAYDVLVRRATDLSVVEPLTRAGVLGLKTTSHFEKLQFLESLGFWAGIRSGATQKLTHVDFQEPRMLSVSSFLTGLMARERPYAIDGLVLRCDDDQTYARLGNTAHHPRGSIAFKQSGETAVTTIRSIHVGVGRSGKISFRAELNPVFLSGATLAFATLHNAEFIESGRYAPGAQVKIKRSGEVIPYIIGLEIPSDQPYALPNACLCGSPLTRQGPDLFCLDNALCPYRDSESLLYFVQSLEIYGVSDKILEKLRTAGLVASPADLFELTRDDLLTLDGFGPKLADNVLGAIASKRRLGLAMFLTSLGLKRGGKVKCAQVARAFGSLDRVLRLTPEELVNLDGWAQKSAEDFLTSLQAKRSLIAALQKWITVDDAAPQTVVANPLSGKKLCITGALSLPRKAYEDRLKALGAAVQASVSPQTDYLVCNEPSGSSKYQKALALGVPILTEQELVAMLDAAL
jgi:DNA ligase (NAD+)